MDFDEDSSSETEFDEDSSSETEFDEDAVDFDGNDTNVYFIAKPFDDAAKKAESILNKTLTPMKKQDKGPTVTKSMIVSTNEEKWMIGKSSRSAYPTAIN